MLPSLQQVNAAELTRLAAFDDGRLERNMFPEFLGGSGSVTSDAELNRLPEPLLARIGGFLSVPDFCRVSQTSKVREYNGVAVVGSRAYILL
ncbi:unnamed protein product [Phytophthora fragariaefolia]|uniref:Unnamed protein product n=1 Tax=Phytophthora fragariaefolia TaxID=1490495 RepID=A0A9W7D8I5_9STRA|nr:unnamed protein product [Phytophthora fragariaefolia]